jgi:hypothetical protein
MIIGTKLTITDDEKVLSREVVVEKTADGKESLKITIKVPTLGEQAQAKIAEETVKQPEASQPVRPVHITSQTNSSEGAPSTTGQTHSSHWLDRPLSPLMAENLQAKESMEGEMEVKRKGLSAQEIQCQINLRSPIEQVHTSGGRFEELVKREASKVS